MTETLKSSFAKVAADTNVLLSAAAGGAARRLFRKAKEKNLSFVTTAFNLDEAKEYLPALSKQYRIALGRLAQALADLPLEVVGEEAYLSHVEQARELIEKRDPDDVPLLALALKLEIPIWSNDRDFRDTPLPVEVYPTGKLLDAIGI